MHWWCPPLQAGTQFKTSLAELMDILMSKQPSYIRCIKPNDFKRDGVFDESIIRHQTKYLGLMENLRVRRAGFCYRRNLQYFLQRSAFHHQFTPPHCAGLYNIYVYLCTYIRMHVCAFVQEVRMCINCRAKFTCQLYAYVVWCGVVWCGVVWCGVVARSGLL